MNWFRKKDKASLSREVAGLKFANPLGIDYPCQRLNTGFIALTPDSDNMLDWIAKVEDYRKGTVLGVNLQTDILRSFALVYDFANFIIIDPDSDNGIGSPDISDIAQLLDEIVNLRFCYEGYTPVFLRISKEDTPDEIHPLCACARLSGLDGIVAPDPLKVKLVMEECQGRVPVIGVANTEEEALAELSAGATLVLTTLRPIPFAKLLKKL